MTDKTQPDAGSTHIIRYALELGLLWIDGDGRNKVREALDALDALEAIDGSQDTSCEHCHGSGEVLMHTDDCDDELCALNGDQHSCAGKVEDCRCVAPKAAPGVGNSGFDHKTAADFLSGKTVSDEAVRKFVQASRWAHDERASLGAMLLSVRGELASREAEIALLKKALLEAEAAPQPAPAPLSDAVEHYLEAQDALDNRECAGINAEPYEKLIRRRNTSRKDLDAALAAQGGKA